MTYGPPPTGNQNYKEQQILNASPAERIVLLYNGAIKFLIHAKAAIEAGNVQERYNNNKRATEIIMYLQSTLDMEKGKEIASNLYRIYSYMLNRLIDVDVKNNAEAAEDVIGKLKELNASWMKIAQGDVGQGAVQSSPQPQIQPKSVSSPQQQAVERDENELPVRPKFDSMA